MSGLKNIRIVNRYDVMGLSDEEFAMAKALVLSEPPVDTVVEENLPLAANEQAFAVELLPGQYDQREDFAEQCIQLITQKIVRWLLLLRFMFWKVSFLLMK